MNNNLIPNLDWKGLEMIVKGISESHSQTVFGTNREPNHNLDSYPLLSLFISKTVAFYVFRIFYPKKCPRLTKD